MMLQQIVKYINLILLILLIAIFTMFLVINFNPYLLNNFFEVKDIRINGTEKTNPDELRQILTPNLNNLISFDKDHAKSLLEQVGWVKRANIKKIYPNTLIINIIEADPFAIYYDNQNNYLIDIDGQIIYSNPDINVYKNLLIVRGEEAKTKLNEIIKEINIYFPDVRNRINELEFIEKRRWNLFLSGNLLIKLPDTDVKESLNNLKKLFEDKQVLESNIIEVDLRIKGRAVIKVDGEQVRFGLEEV